MDETVQNVSDATHAFYCMTLGTAAAVGLFTYVWWWVLGPDAPGTLVPQPPPRGRTLTNTAFNARPADEKHDMACFLSFASNARYVQLVQQLINTLFRDAVTDKVHFRPKPDAILMASCARQPVGRWQRASSTTLRPIVFRCVQLVRLLVDGELPELLAIQVEAVFASDASALIGELTSDYGELESHEPWLIPVANVRAGVGDAILEASKACPAWDMMRKHLMMADELVWVLAHNRNEVHRLTLQKS